jgi:hypothetical protein
MSAMSATAVSEVTLAGALGEVGGVNQNTANSGAMYVISQLLPSISIIGIANSLGSN